VEREFSGGRLQDAFLAIAATSVPSVNEAVYRAADATRTPLQCVDDIENCHFYYGAVVHAGDLQIAISTNGKSPALRNGCEKSSKRSSAPNMKTGSNAPRRTGCFTRIDGRVASVK